MSELDEERRLARIESKVDAILAEARRTNGRLSVVEGFRESHERDHARKLGEQHGREAEAGEELARQRQQQDLWFKVIATGVGILGAVQLAQEFM